MTTSPWTEAVTRAVAALDPRDPSLLVRWRAELSAADSTGRPAPSIWSDFDLPAVVVPEDEDDEVPQVLGTMMRKGPVLTELGFHHRRGNVREAREAEMLGAVLLAAGAATSPSGVVAVVMPAGIATSVSGSSVRETLGRTLSLRHAIFGRGVLEGVHSQFEVACLVWSANAETDGSVCFLRVPKEVESRQDIQLDQDVLLAHKAERGRFGYWANVDLSQGESLAFDLRNPDLLERQQQLAGLGQPTAIGSLFDVLRPVSVIGRPSVSSRNDASEGDGEGLRVRGPYCDADVEGALREISGRDVTPDGLRGPNDDTRYRVPDDRDIFLMPGDLILRSVLPPGGAPNARLTVSRYDGVGGQEIAGSSILVLRPKKHTNARQAMAASLFLQSDVAFRLVTARGLHLTPRALAALEVPMPDESTMDAMASIVDVRDSHREWLGEADEVLKRLYVRPDTVAAKQDVMDVSRTLRARVAQGHALDDPDERYRAIYAYPVAMRWRMAEAACSGSDPDRALRAVLEAAEVTLAYAACIALVFAKIHEVDLPCLKEVRSKLASGRSGMGFGDWANILNEATTSRAARRVPAEAPLSEVRRFFTAESLEPARARLKQLRDGQAHGRHLTGQDLVHSLEQAKRDLLTLLEAAAPLSDLGLIHVDEARVDSLRGRSVLKYREFRGDHPVVPYREVHVDGTQFEVGSLYLRDTDNGWHLLRPFMLADPCPRCNAWSMFTVDRVVRSVPEYKSMDHGHAEERPDCLDALIHVGLVES